jgi:hypothetical protein
VHFSTRTCKTSSHGTETCNSGAISYKNVLRSTLGIATLEKGKGPADVRFTDTPCSSFILRSSFDQSVEQARVAAESLTLATAAAIEAAILAEVTTVAPVV